MPPRAPDIPSPHGDNPSLNVPPEDLSPQESIALLVGAMEDRSHDASFLETSMPLLISISQEHWPEAIDSGAVTLILNVLEHHVVNHETLVEMCLFFLLGVQGHLLEEEPHEVDDNDTPIRPIEWVRVIVLAMNSHKEHLDIQRFGAILLPSFSGDATATTVFVEAGAIPAIFYAVKKLPNVKGIQGACSFAITELLQNDNDGLVVDEIMNANGLEVLMDYLKCHGSASHSDDSMEVEALRYVCASIAFMTKDRPSVMAAIVEMDGMSTILSTLKHQVLNAEILGELFRIIFFFRNNHEATEAFVAAGGIRTLTALLNENPGDDTLARGTCLVFGSMVVCDNDIADIVAADGGLAALVQAMPHHEDDVETPFLACAAMSSCLSVDNTVHVLDAIKAAPNVIQIVVKAMQKHADHEDLQGAAAYLLRDLTSSSIAMCHDLVNSGGVQAIVDAMKQFPLNTELLNCGVCIIANVVKAATFTMLSDFTKDASSNDMFESIHESGAVPILIDILVSDKFQDADDIYCNAIFSLQCLARASDEVKEQIASAGVEDRLFQQKIGCDDEEESRADSGGLNKTS
jgi:hypothetical protein